MRAWKLLAIALAGYLIAAPVLAQQATGPSPFGVAPPSSERVLPRPPAAGPVETAGAIQRAWLWVLETQAQLHRQLAAAVRGLKTGDPLNATLILVALSFAYGVLHAAGPGHGKAVISSYVLADGRTVRRGVLLAFLAALIQAFSALVVVIVFILLFRATGLQIRAAEGWLETASWAFVAAVGAWLLYYQLRSVLPAKPALAHVHPTPLSAHEQHHPHSHADHAHAAACEACGHSHLPSVAQLKGDLSWRRALSLAFAVGVRPCTGAILVLVFATGQGLLWAGVFSTFAMALGTALTVSALAAMAVGSRELAVHLAGSGSSKWSDRIQTAAGLGGASLVLVLGLLFFIGSLSGARSF
jgi:ABC-type nickel/cobalt efflux system permease component RcnA